VSFVPTRDNFESTTLLGRFPNDGTHGMPKSAEGNIVHLLCACVPVRVSLV